jgi:hypothetical protein
VRRVQRPALEACNKETYNASDSLASHCSDSQMNITL